MAARERTMSNSRNSFHSEIFGKGDIWRRRHFQEVLTCPLGFWRGVKLSPQKTRREERRVRKTKQGKRPWVESRKGLTKLDFEEKLISFALSGALYVMLGHFSSGGGKYTLFDFPSL